MLMKSLRFSLRTGRKAPRGVPACTVLHLAHLCLFKRPFGGPVCLDRVHDPQPLAFPAERQSGNEKRKKVHLRQPADCVRLLDASYLVAEAASVLEIYMKNSCSPEPRNFTTHLTWYTSSQAVGI